MFYSCTHSDNASAKGNTLSNSFAFSNKSYFFALLFVCKWANSGALSDKTNGTFRGATLLKAQNQPFLSIMRALGCLLITASKVKSMLCFSAAEESLGNGYGAASVFQKTNKKCQIMVGAFEYISVSMVYSVFADLGSFQIELQIMFLVEILLLVWQATELRYWCQKLPTWRLILNSRTSPNSRTFSLVFQLGLRTAHRHKNCTASLSLRYHHRKLVNVTWTLHRNEIQPFK